MNTVNYRFDYLPEIYRSYREFILEYFRTYDSSQSIMTTIAPYQLIAETIFFNFIENSAPFCINIPYKMRLYLMAYFRPQLFVKHNKRHAAAMTTHGATHGSSRFSFHSQSGSNPAAKRQEIM